MIRLFINQGDVMSVSQASAQWKGDLKTGQGSMKLGSGAWEGPFSFKTRFEGERGANPEELIGAALAGCYSMALSHGLASKGHTPTRVDTQAKVHLNPVDGGFAITRIDLTCQAVVPGISTGEFQQIAEDTKKGCPVSKVLAGTSIELHATVRPE
jgi:osmotically inducible protein OsmC